MEGTFRTSKALEMPSATPASRLRAMSCPCLETSLPRIPTFPSSPVANASMGASNAAPFSLTQEIRPLRAEIPPASGDEEAFHEVRAEPVGEDRLLLYAQHGGERVTLRIVPGRSVHPGHEHPRDN